MRVKAPIIEVSSKDAVVLTKLLDQTIPIAPLFIEETRVGKHFRSKLFLLCLSITKEGATFYLNLTARREDEL